MRRNYDTKLSASKLSGKIITGNYQLVYYVAENVGIIGILAYPKIYLQFHQVWQKMVEVENKGRIFRNSFVKIFVCSAI